MGTITLLFRVTISNSDGNIKSTSIYVTIIGDFVVTGSLSAPTGKVSNSSSVVLAAQAVVPSGLIGRYTWSSPEISLLSQGESTSPVVVWVQSNVTSFFEYSVPIGVLAAGKKYTFVLTARTFKSAASGSIENIILF
jgi:hypothetical protein